MHLCLPALWCGTLVIGMFGMGLPAHATEVDTLLTQGLACELPDSALTGFPAALTAADPRAFTKPSDQHALPSFDAYTLSAPAKLFGRIVTTIILQPGRVLAVLPEAEKASVERQYGIRPSKVPYSPDDHEVSENRRLVAYTGPGGSKYGAKLFVGCQYEVQEAATWGTYGDATLRKLLGLPR